MAKKKNNEENIVEEIVLDEEFDDDEDYGGAIVEMTDDEGNTYYYAEQMIIPVGEDDFALLVEITGHDHEHCEHKHEHEHEGCGCGCEEGDVIIAKIVTDENGDDIYIEPTDEEFEAVQKAYEALIEADFYDDVED